MADGKGAAVRQILSYQFLIIAVVGTVFWITQGNTIALYSILGGAVAFIPNVYFALWINRAARQDAKKIVNSFYAAEFGKLLLTAALFIIVFQLPSLQLFPLLAGYVTALSVFWFALLMR